MLSSAFLFKSLFVISSNAVISTIHQPEIPQKIDHAIMSEIFNSLDSVQKFIETHPQVIEFINKHTNIQELFLHAIEQKTAGVFLVPYFAIQENIYPLNNSQELQKMKNFVIEMREWLVNASIKEKQTYEKSWWSSLFFIIEILQNLSEIKINTMFTAAIIQDQLLFHSSSRYLMADFVSESSALLLVGVDRLLLKDNARSTMQKTAKKLNSYLYDYARSSNVTYSTKITTILEWIKNTSQYWSETIQGHLTSYQNTLDRSEKQKKLEKLKNILNIKKKIKEYDDKKEKLQQLIASEETQLIDKQKEVLSIEETQISEISI